ncbi:hypothetical protein HG15A2_30770 [Adhaeretor mobilis]|uniref:Uncharacterized protein n=1 Tax=Adhaeretor mobilis TaxID=1930276 RepID=A0A517MY54_9BACT|nr:hypothetical protein HG15A2_30770 [Adhaeretor mobilis]
MQAELRRVRRVVEVQKELWAEVLEWSYSLAAPSANDKSGAGTLPTPLLEHIIRSLDTQVPLMSSSPSKAT